MAIESQNYEKLAVWKRAMDLAEAIYGTTKNFPKDELYALTNQMRRAAVSIPSNIAEGRSRRTTKEFMRFVNVANGSLAELETQVLLAQRLGYIMEEQKESLLGETVQIGRMLNGLYTSLQAKVMSPQEESLTSDL